MGQGGSKGGEQHPQCSQDTPVITTGLGPNFVLSTLPTGPGEEEDLQRKISGVLLQHRFPLPKSFTVPHPHSLPRVRGHRTPDLGAALTPELLPRFLEAIQETRAAGLFKRRHKFHKEDAEKGRSTPNTSADWKER